MYLHIICGFFNYWEVYHFDCEAVQVKRRKGCRAHSPTFPSLHLRHNSFSNPFVAVPTSQLILQPFRCFTYVTVHSSTLLSLLLCQSSSLNSPGEPPTVKFILQLSKTSENFNDKIRHNGDQTWGLRRCYFLARAVINRQEKSGFKQGQFVGDLWGQN